MPQFYITNPTDTINDKLVPLPDKTNNHYHRRNKIMKVEFVDLHRQYLSIKEETDKAIAGIINSASFVGGEEVKSFEEAFASYVGVKYCIGCANGTDSIEILLQAMGIGRGDEVIVPSHSWISTAEAVSTVGAIPVFVDTIPLRYTIDPSRIEETITSKTKAIIPVHLGGLPAEMDEIMAIATKHRLFVLEDCAQAHGAVYKGKRVGSIGHAASFSFYPGKNLGAYGDAGGMVTNDPAIAEKARMIGNHGQKGKHNHLIEGRNSRLDTLQAAVLNVKLPHLDKWNSLRRQHAKLYFNLLSGIDLGLPDYPSYSRAVYHLFIIQSRKRDELAEFLKAGGVSTGIHYPKMLPFLPPYKKSTYEALFPVSRNYQDKILSLPMFAELLEAEIKSVADNIERFLQKN